MEPIKIISLIALLFYCADPVQSQGNLAEETQPAAEVGGFQRVTCAYKPGEVDGSAKPKYMITQQYNNTAVCELWSNSERLLCMSVMHMVNTTDAFGNITRHLNVSMQGCFTQESGDVSSCSSPDEKCNDTLRDGKPNRPTYCCCSGERCNREENCALYPFVPVPTTPRIVSDADPAITRIVTLIAGIVTPIFILSLIIVVGFYIIRKRNQQKQLALQNKVDQYNYDMRMYSPDPPLVNFDDMVMGTCIHRGRFGDVYKARLNDSDVCVKYFHSSQKNLFNTEKEIYDILDGNVRTVVQCLACNETAHPDGSVQYIVIMEYLPLGSLASYLKTHTLNWKEMCSLAQSAASGLGYLHGETFINGVHKHAVVHRDVNSRNILVRANMTCAIADMGFSMKIRGSKVIKLGVEESAEDGSLRDVGTVRYMAPEILDCAVNLRDCESSLKQIDMYAFSLVVWELLTRCKDLLLVEPKRFVLPFEEELGGHPGFEAMRIHVAKEQRRPPFPAAMKQTETTQLLRETIEECWDTDSEARLSAVCVEERFKDMDSLMEVKGKPELSKNDCTPSIYEKRKRLSSDSTDVKCGSELSPLLETETPCSEMSNATTMTNLLQTPLEPTHSKPDVNVEMDKERQMPPKCGRNRMAERNTLSSLDDDVELAVHENTLIPIEEAKARKAAEEERSKRLWEEAQQQSQPDGTSQPPPRPPRTVQLDVHNEVRDPATQRVKENNLNVRRHNSQRTLYESSTSSNGGPGMIVTIPDKLDPNNKPNSRPKSLTILNIKPEAS